MREFATGSTTSSKVMELMSNQASEMFQATKFKNATVQKLALALVVTFIVRRVQSLVQVRVEEAVFTNLVQLVLNWSKAIKQN